MEVSQQHQALSTASHSTPRPNSLAQILCGEADSYSVGQEDSSPFKSMATKGSIPRLQKPSTDLYGESDQSNPSFLVLQLPETYFNIIFLFITWFSKKPLFMAYSERHFFTKHAVAYGRSRKVAGWRPDEVNDFFQFA
jgi:hypothetical protein